MQLHEQLDMRIVGYSLSGIHSCDEFLPSVRDSDGTRWIGWYRALSIPIELYDPVSNGELQEPSVWEIRVERFVLPCRRERRSETAY
jgi:hypothetical protein